MEGIYREARLRDRGQKQMTMERPLIFAGAAALFLLVAIAAVLFLQLKKQPRFSSLLSTYTPALLSTATPNAEKTGLSISVEVEPTNTPLALPVQAVRAEPSILIYHTHATEAYTQTEANPYIEKGNFRTEDTEKNVVAVGKRLKQILEQEYGYVVIHDTTNHEPPKLSTAYGRSEETMRRMQSQYPSIRLFIDMHRDAYGSSATGAKDYVMLDGSEVARIMFVVGTGEGATGTGFSQMPDFNSNYAIANYMTELLAANDPKLVREVRVKTGRYNQHVSSRCVLVEVGHNANTLEQALAAMPYLAEAIAGSMQNGADGKNAPVDVTVWAPG